MAAARPPQGQARRQDHQRHRHHPDAARRGQDGHRHRPLRVHERRSASTPCSRCASPRWARSSASRAAPPAAATRSSCRWRTSTSTSPATSTPSARPTTCSPPWSTATSCTATSSSIDPLTISWRRCVDLNDRAMREIVNGLGGRLNGLPRQTGYDITVASEVMAILGLATSLKDLRERLGRITFGYSNDGQAADGRRHRRRRRHDGAPQGRHQAEPHADARGQRRAHPRRPVRQHRPGQQLDHRRQGRHEARRLRRHRERLRRRPRRREVHGHHLPLRRLRARAPWSSPAPCAPSRCTAACRSTRSCSRPRTTRLSRRAARTSPSRSRT